MSLEFRGTATPLDQEGLDEAAHGLGVGTAEVWTVLAVETKGCGFLADRRPTILFERHIFSRRTNHRFDSADPDISNPMQGGYGEDGAHEYDRLERAMALDQDAALCSASWGIAQVMGFNAEFAGYDNVEDMVAAMVASENNQVMAMALLITHNNLDAALRSHDWRAFAQGYNGPEYAQNQYDAKLSAAYDRYAAGQFPDLTVRSAQAYLTYLGYDPGPIDGTIGRLTLAAVGDFQKNNSLTVTSNISIEFLSFLKGKVEAL